MNLVKIKTKAGTRYINPEYVVVVAPYGSGMGIWMHPARPADVPTFEADRAELERSPSFWALRDELKKAEKADPMPAPMYEEPMMDDYMEDMD